MTSSRTIGVGSPTHSTEGSSTGSTRFSVFGGDLEKSLERKPWRPVSIVGVGAAAEPDVAGLSEAATYPGRTEVRNVRLPALFASAMARVAVPVRESVALATASSEMAVRLLDAFGFDGIRTAD